jgi:hypothetical protein
VEKNRSKDLYGPAGEDFFDPIREAMDGDDRRKLELLRLHPFAEPQRTPSKSLPSPNPSGGGKSLRDLALAPTSFHLHFPVEQSARVWMAAGRLAEGLTRGIAADDLHSAMRDLVDSIDLIAKDSTSSDRYAVVEAIKNSSVIESLDLADPDNRVAFIRVSPQDLRVVNWGPSSKVAILPWPEFRETYLARVEARIRKSPPEQKGLFTIIDFDEHPVVVGPGQCRFELKPEEVETIHRGKRLAPEHPLSKLLDAVPVGTVLLYQGRYEGASKAGTATDTILFALQRLYPERLIARDPPADETNARVRKLADEVLKAGSDITAVIADKSFNVQDRKIIQNLEANLAEAKVNILRFGNARDLHRKASPEVSSIIVITGHQDAQLAKFVHELGRSGVLRDKLVLFNSCQTPLSKELVMAMTGRYGASAVLSYEGKILPSQVRDVMNRMIDAAEQGGTGRSVARVLLEAILKTGMTGIWTVSVNEAVHPNCFA